MRFGRFGRTSSANRGSRVSRDSRGINVERSVSSFGLPLSMSMGTSVCRDRRARARGYMRVGMHKREKKEGVGEGVKGCRRVFCGV